MSEGKKLLQLKQTKMQGNLRESMASGKVRQETQKAIQNGRREKKKKMH